VILIITKITEMKLIYLLLISLAGCLGRTASRPENTSTLHQKTTSIYDFKIMSIDGKPVELSLYKGKKMLIVNTASECGYTPQYKELQKLHEQYGDKVVVLGFPSNDFGSQEPGSHEQIQAFCEKNYGVTFPLFEKSIVKGENKTPLYAWLSDKNKNGWNNEEPKWNFCKYLIDQNGELVKFFPSGVTPLSDEMLKEIKK
jgi:glutathione peroxidase